MTFSMSLPVVFKRTIGQKDFSILYEFLFGLGMMTVIVDLNRDG